MKTKSNIKKAWLGTLLVVVLVAAAMSVTVFAGDAEAAEHTSNMYATAWSLVPPLVAIIPLCSSVSWSAVCSMRTSAPS